MKVDDLMTRDVVAVRADTSLKEVARLLAERRVSGAPVVDEEGRVLGVVSEADILARERGAGRERFDLLAWLSEWNGETANDKLAALTAGEAMSTPAVTIRAGESLTKAAAYLVDRGVNRLPVVGDDGRLVGILSRADLVRAFAREDAEIEREIREDVLVHALSIPPGAVEVEVSGGEVTLSGRVETKELGELLLSLTSHVLGVVDVRSVVHWERADPRRPAHSFLSGGAG